MKTIQNTRIATLSKLQPMYNTHELEQFGNELTSCLSQPLITTIHIFTAQ